MSLSLFNRKSLGMALALAVVAAVAAPAQAGWGHSSGGSSGGSSGSWGSSGGSSGGSWGGSSGGSSGGSWGSSGGSSGHGHLFPRLHNLFHHHSSGGSWGSSGGSHGSSGGSHGSSGGSWGSSGGSHGSSGGSQGSTYYTIPAAPAPETRQLPAGPMNEAQPNGDLPQPENNTSLRAGKALLTVSVPSDAKVFVNGVATSSKGGQRTFVSRGLSSGFKYTYEVRVEAKRDGKLVEDVKTVQLRAGENADLAFDLPKGTPETSLTVHVPANAKVFLGGNETTATGEVRTYTTTGLAEGQEWSNYKIRIELVRNGEKVTREEVISLKSGEDRTLRFDLDSEKVADAR